jgi:hypothetical protein
MLQPGEEILLEAELQGKIGIIRRLVPGRAYLTTQRIIWLSRRIPLLRLLFCFYRVPNAFTIPISDIRSMILGKEPSRAGLLIMTHKGQYSLRLGTQPFFWPRSNPATTTEWFEAIQRLREGNTQRNPKIEDG